MNNLRKENIKDSEIQKFFIYNDGELAFCKNLRDLPHSFPLQIENCAILFVHEGKAVIEIEGTSYEVEKNNVFVCSPNSIVDNGLMSVDFDGNFIFVSSDYIQRLMPITDSWDFKLFVEKHPLVVLSEEEAVEYCEYYELISSKAQRKFPAQKKVIDTLMLAFVYEMQDCVNRLVQCKPKSFTSREYLFKRFIELLESSYPKSRQVSYYAGRLHVTPKYLSSVCKQVGGERPSSLIDRYVLRDIDRLMKYDRMSIKEIAYELEFPNLSFFGKYVKKHHGVSPTAYREKILSEAGSAS